MPTDPQSLVIYAIVLLTVFWLSRGFRKRQSKAKPCGHNCASSRAARHPAIQRIMDRREK